MRRLEHPPPVTKGSIVVGVARGVCISLRPRACPCRQPPVLAAATPGAVAGGGERKSDAGSETDCEHPITGLYIVATGYERVPFQFLHDMLGWWERQGPPAVSSATAALAVRPRTDAGLYLQADSWDKVYVDDVWTQADDRCVYVSVKTPGGILEGRRPPPAFRRLELAPPQPSSFVRWRLAQLNAACHESTSSEDRERFLDLCHVIEALLVPAPQRVAAAASALSGIYEEVVAQGLKRPIQYRSLGIRNPAPLPSGNEGAGSVPPAKPALLPKYRLRVDGLPRLHAIDLGRLIDCFPSTITELSVFVQEGVLVLDWLSSAIEPPHLTWTRTTGIS